jgi:hypothetical protein
VVEDLVRSLERLDYPRDKLDVKLLLEEDDDETIARLASLELEPCFELVVVPVAEPRTKPKACNYGLLRARGEFAVIFDAEDRPEPDQLRKAVAAFRAAPPEIVCLQAQLNFWNREQNILTRWFTAEYSQLFDLYLPGLMRSGAPIPLGGTSNHFPTHVLRELGAWDPFNVTEDADLGIRLARFGFRTGVLPSTTYEEANCQLRNWIRQRSRWIKGYTQTWLVHMRHPVALWRELGPAGWWHLQLQLGGVFFPLLVSPIYAGLTAVLGAWAAGALELSSAGQGVLIAVAATGLAGHHASVFTLVSALRRRGYRHLRKWTLLVPAYWFLMSVAAWKGVVQLLTKPSYWEKTMHGLAGSPEDLIATSRAAVTSGSGTWKVAQLLARLMLRTGQTRAGAALWSAAHRAAIRLVARYVLRGQPGSAVYLKGGFGFGRPVYGLSDIDMIVVVPADPGRPGTSRAGVRARFSRLCRVFPPLSALFEFWVYERPELERVLDASYLVSPVSAADEMELRDHPGLFGPSRDWRRLGSPPTRRPEPVRDVDERRLNAWLELQFWWRQAFRAVVSSERPHVPFLCVKLVAEAARVWLWLTRGEQVFGQLPALSRALAILPEEEQTIRLMTELYRKLPQAPDPPLVDALPCLVRLSTRIAAQLERELQENGATSVRLERSGLPLVLQPDADARLCSVAGHALDLLPLCDWRARTLPEAPDEAFALVSGDPGDPDRLSSAAQAGRTGPYPAFRVDGLLLLPTSNWKGSRFRAVQCRATDPVSFAVAERRAEAAFPNVPGLSASASASRSVAEHRIMLRERGQEQGGRELGLLLSAARAALFQQSLEEGDASLALTCADVAEALAARGNGAHALADEAVQSLRAYRADRVPPPPRLVGELRRLVERLPAYR